jgi:colanic acid/amylovoran biosynthesis protein
MNNRPLIIEIHGTSTINRGAELMAIAIAERMREAFPGVRIAVPPEFGDFESRARYGFLSTTDFPGRIRSPIIRGVINRSAPEFRKRLGVVTPLEIDAVLDASGYAFHQNDCQAIQDLTHKMNCRARAHQPLILLPQAFGPLDWPRASQLAKQLFSRSALICARDQKSLATVRALGEYDQLRHYPDFTVGITAHMPKSMPISVPFCAVVPNYRMIDKTGKGKQYLLFLSHAIERIKQLGMSPLIVLHDSKEDHQIVEQLDRHPGLPVFSDPDPRVLKGVLGQAHCVIASRFHSIVSTLSQGVPCIGTGWSHKYPALFKDFNVSDWLIEDLTDIKHLDRLFSQLANPLAVQQVSQQITVSTQRILGLIDEMWNEIFATLKKHYLLTGDLINPPRGMETDS